MRSARFVEPDVGRGRGASMTKTGSENFTSPNSAKFSSFYVTSHYDFQWTLPFCAVPLSPASSDFNTQLASIRKAHRRLVYHRCAFITPARGTAVIDSSSTSYVGRFASISTFIWKENCDEWTSLPFHRPPPTASSQVSSQRSSRNVLNE